jgi:ubiquinone/menaquinone biosynthesis C-methylase UbiE
MYDRMAKTDEKRMGPIRDTVAGGATGRVIEIGCGTGLNFAHYDWSQVERLDATEPDVYMLRRAQARAAALSTEAQSRLTLHEAPAESLPFPDASFDCAVATLVLCTVRDQQQTLVELLRVLRPGGQLRLVEHVLADGFTAKVQKTLQPVYGWMMAGCHMTRDTASAIREAGFELEITGPRESFGPLWPGFIGVATKPVA